MAAKLDLDLQPAQIAALTSADGLVAFFAALGYPTGSRRSLPPAGLGLGQTERNATQVELVSDEGFLRVVFVRLKSVTAKARADLVRTFGRAATDEHLLVLTSDFESLEFVLIEKEARSASVGGVGATTVARGRVFVVPRQWPDQMLRIVRRLTYTMDDGLRQYDKLKGVFAAAHFSGTYFTNRALFADHYLDSRLKDDAAWKEDPGPAFHGISRIAHAAPDRIGGKSAAFARQEFFDPLFSLLGFRPTHTQRVADGIEPDYRLADGGGSPRTVALVYQWQRWLDGPDPNDVDRPAENPGAAVVSLLERGDAEWAIVTNGKLWRLYSRAAHSRSTNFYEVDLQDALLSSGLTDPNEAFRYWWLFFRVEAFVPVAPEGAVLWLDRIAEGSRNYAREVEAELKRRVFYDVVPMLAQGFLHDRRSRLRKSAEPADVELEQVRAATLTLLYRILFLLYAESRDLLPVREAAYYEVSVKRMKEEIRAIAGDAQSVADSKLDAHFSRTATTLYDRLSDRETGLFAAMASGRPSLNVPKYDGGLFRLDPAEAADEREAEVSTFLNEHRVPDAFLAVAIDRLTRVEDPRTYALAFVDYKSLGVRQLGSIYEGLLEYTLVIADQDLAVKEGRTLGEYIPLAKTRGKAAKKTIRQVKKGEPILRRDKSERKSTGSYYTPDHIVEFIVENTVGPVLKRKTEALRAEFRAAEQTFHRQLANVRADPRLMLGHASAAGLRSRRGLDPLATATQADFRAFALAEAGDSHRDLVDKLFDLKVLDPAMGSGHFLVEAVDFITDELLDFLNAFPNNPVSALIDRTREAILESLREQGLEVDDFLRRQLTDVHLLKRHVLKRCIYGVDLNPLATELAKVSLWLDAFTLGAPLSFLDHHLRTGNSLIGASVPELDDALIDKRAQHTVMMFGIDHEAAIALAVNNVLQIARLTDSTAGEVLESKRRFDDSRRSLAGYRFLLDILTAKHFGHRDAMSVIVMGRDLDLSLGRDAVLESLNPRDRRHIDEVEHLAARQSFFHWDLEFPEIFYTLEGQGLARVARLPSEHAGFDCVVGNPPYDELSEHAAGRELPEKRYFASASLYDPARGGRMNLFRLFIVRTLRMLKHGGRHGFIVPMAILGDTFTEATRRHMLEGGLIRDIAAFPQKDDPHTRVFFEAKLSTAVLLCEHEVAQDHSIVVRTYPRNVLTDRPKECRVTVAELRVLDAEHMAIPSASQEDLARWRAILAAPRVARFQDVGRCYLGEVMNNAKNAHLVSEKPIGPLLLRGANINYYVLLDEAKQGTPLYLDERKYLREYADDPRATHHECERIGFQQSSPMDNWRRLIACRVPAGHYCVDKIRYFAPDARYDLFAMLAVFNSAASEWRFGLTSTNNNVNEWSIEAIPIPRFERLARAEASARPNPQATDTWLGDAYRWEQVVLAKIEATPTYATSWPDSIHDALAVAGREMTRLAELRQGRISEFTTWLLDRVGCSADEFTGISRLRGGQADLDTMDWSELRDLLQRNVGREVVESGRDASAMQQRFESAAAELTADRRRFETLGAAIDRVVWILLGLAPDGLTASPATDGRA